MDYIVEDIDIEDKVEVERVKEFLKGLDLGYEDDIDYTLVARKGDRIIGSCSKSKDTLKSFGVDDEFRGEGVGVPLIEGIKKEFLKKENYNYFIFTKVENKDIFESLGSRVVGEGEKSVVLEDGFYNIGKWLGDIERKYQLGSGEKGAVVVNCNPFTKGHRYLIEKALESEDELLVFVVEEDRSYFSFVDRYNMVVEGLKDLKGVKVIPSGRYIISRGTFPTYFLKDKAVIEGEAQRIDLEVFGSKIAKRLNIKRRYVGSEKSCLVTKRYNETMFKVLPRYGVDVMEIPRKEVEEDVISASNVRKILKGEVDESLEKYMLKTSIEYLKEIGLYG